MEGGRTDRFLFLSFFLFFSPSPLQKVEPWEPTEGEGEPSEGGSDDEMSTEGKWEGETAAL